jgi:RNA polymerase sigma-70 factor (ECF subfamily)
LTADDVDRFERSRPRLEAIAYRLLGSSAEAQDIVQEAFLRWHAADVDRIEVPEAWLTKVVTNLCLSQLTSARARRETYVGQWLPEPLLAGDPMLDPADSVEQREAVTYAVLTLMERLSPNERAVYVLREAFGYAHSDIAEILEISEAASQQILHRAKRHVAAAEARRDIDEAAAQRIVEQFLAAAATGQTDELARLLTTDAIAIGDGGGKVPARTRAVEGAVAVATFLWRLVQPTRAKRVIVGGSAELYAWTANGEPAVVVAVEGRVVAIMCLEVTAEGIAACRTQANPDKLQRATDQWAAADHGEPLLVM